jgi:succinate-acetate transporter protein
MSAIDEQHLSAGGEDGMRASIFLQPIAAPSVLGYFAGATGFLLVGIWLGGGIATTPQNAISLFPFLLLFAGVGQLAAAMWSYKARDAVAASIHGVWGGFWIAYGFLWLMDVTHVFTLPVFGSGFQPLGQWFIYMAVITVTTAFAALGRSPAQFLSRRSSWSQPARTLSRSGRSCAPSSLTQVRVTRQGASSALGHGSRLYSSRAAVGAPAT